MQIFNCLAEYSILDFKPLIVCLRIEEAFGAAFEACAYFPFISCLLFNMRVCLPILRYLRPAPRSYRSSRIESFDLLVCIF